MFAPPPVLCFYSEQSGAMSSASEGTGTHLEGNSVPETGPRLRRGRGRSESSLAPVTGCHLP